MLEKELKKLPPDELAVRIQEEIQRGEFHLYDEGVSLRNGRCPAMGVSAEIPKIHGVPPKAVKRALRGEAMTAYDLPEKPRFTCIPGFPKKIRVALIFTGNRVYVLPTDQLT